ncbi:peptidylprolyl isomerase [Candidatus Methylacidiphilum fumarolicum]|uniref:Periplasmic chaperone PpiD n=2 Tax=Candidatus Methylacidiphilum fumarolicum TaxID=591154 RepID=I0JZK9_METFB|nr:peptidylprolyl isomerase [Candidatus Methylacidiphilum fumarolicum]MBW6415456.1 SurA N-terminal domain-containing protein [Candidatus Methylacidiphilum fumarolicum]TFE69007.1 peptidylprolyl isomerase [Candidatus Methylacidiphilum fumarolicum]TFE74052.1 peptidylprolyl isomerase [Candidatus Methylacidiphilum fumarolicum]TFE74162.1 peptidylprolyl isomerase [Candidatus Methylacidiphilum fumarolicum]TFE74922.1 peptidylprolyl isomerase [Candidatus Methylacidiphilum fumarolicum]
MLKILRTHSWLLVVVLAVIGVSFLLFFNIPAMSGLKNPSVAKIAGKSISLETFRLARQASSIEIALSSGNQPYGENLQQILDQMAWTRLLFLQAAKELHCLVPEEEVVQFIQQLPFLQKEGKYDPAIYQRFVSSFLVPQGITEERFLQVMHEELVIGEVKKVLIAPVEVVSGELDEIYNMTFGAVQVVLFRLKIDPFMQNLQVKPEEIEKEYKSHSKDPDYYTAEKRKAGYVFFPFPPEWQSLKGKELDEAKRKLLEKAEDFSIDTVRLMESSQTAEIEKIAREKNLSYRLTPFFSLDHPPTEVEEPEKFAKAVFELSQEKPVSDPIETSKGYYVIVLLGVEKGVLQPFEQVKSIIEEKLKRKKAFEALFEKSNAIEKELNKALKEGKDIEQVARAQGLVIEKPPSFVPVDPPKDLNAAAEIGFACQLLEPSRLSRFLPTPEGGVFIYLQNRFAPALPNEMEIKNKLEKDLLMSRRQAFLEEWVLWRSKQPGYMPPASLLQTAGIQDK